MELSRNDKCWCGQEKKYKFCHYEQDLKLKELARKGYLIPDRSLLKNQEDIVKLKQSANITRQILDTLEDVIYVGMKTIEIDKLVYDLTVSQGGVPATLGYNGFPNSCCTSINNVVCHGIPDDTVLKDGDILNVDISTFLNGYFTDASRMFKIGNIDEEANKIVEVSKKCLQIGIEAIKPFCSINEIGNAIEPFANSYGYSVVRDFGGHGIGFEFHEDPHVNHYISKSDGMIMVPGMVFTVEPMINKGRYSVKVLKDNWTVVTKDNSLSAQWEHTVVVTENGCEVLT